MSGVTNSPLLTPREAAAKFGVKSGKTILRWVALGKLRGVTLPSGRIRIPEDAVVMPDAVPDEAAS